MKNRFLKIFLLGLFFFLAGGVPVRVWAVEEWSAESREEVSESPVNLETAISSLQNLFSRVEILYSPVPVKLSGGIRPEPRPVFEEARGEGKDVLGVRSGNVEQHPPLVYIRTNKEGVRMYSLNPEFDSSFSEESDVGSREGESVTKDTEPKSRGEVWGAKIAKAEKEISHWLKDSGVMLTLLTATLLFGVVGLIFIVRRVMR